LYLLLLLFAVRAKCATATLNRGKFRADVAPSGAYSLAVPEWGWIFRGALGVPVSQLRRQSGRDALGNYEQVAFTYTKDGKREGIVRLYEDRPVAEFVTRMLTPGANRGAFPDFRGYPAKLYRLGFQPVPHAFYEFGALGSEGPWVLFDGPLHTLMISPADHFFVSDMRSDGKLASAIAQSVEELPAGFSHATVFVAGEGVNGTIDRWGAAMQTMDGRHAPSSEADILLSKLSYWTDHGATYFYQYDPQLGYRGTLLAVRRQFDRLGVPIGSLQLDSWFYPKGQYGDWHKRKWTNGVGGIYLFEADPFLFPNGLSGFHRKLGLPLITHSRWIDKFSPYRQQYRMSGDVIIDPRYWNQTAAWLRDSGVAVYEQDWLGRYAKAEEDLTDPQAFHNEMAAAMRRYGLTMQYCMAAPADFLQGAHYDNLTTIRTSHDRFQRSDWDMFLYDSRLATALGIWPWTDVFLSSEEANLALSTLSAGPVGVGDALRDIDAADLLHAIRSDGEIVKPDVTIRPVDAMYLRDARGIRGPMVADTWTDFGKLRIAYVFAYARQEESAVEIRPQDLGFRGPVYFYNWKLRKGERAEAGGAANLPFTDGWGYAVVAPMGPSGMAFVGDADQFATAGRVRITGLTDDGIMRFTVAFAAGEAPQTVVVYSPRKPQVLSAGGNITERYDQQDHLAWLTVHSGHQPEVTVEVRKAAE
jgi:hypothetical protein